jgi:hypothetical protein
MRTLGREEAAGPVLGEEVSRWPRWRLDMHHRVF